MARPVDRRRSTRSRVSSSDTPAQSGVFQRVVGGVDDSLAEVAQSLQQALGIGAAAAVRNEIQEDRKAFQQGIEDFGRGTTDPELAKRRETYRRAQSQLRARADWARDRQDLDDVLRRMDFDSLAEDEVLAAVDEFAAKKYAGMEQEDPEYADWMGRALAAKREQLVARHRENTIAAIREKDAVDLQVAFNDLSTESPEDAYALLDEQVAALYDGPERNEMYFAVLRNAAIEQGRPELLLEMPDSYASGAPTPKNNPKWADRYRNALAQAQARADAADKQARAEAEAAYESRKVDLVQRILAGDDDVTEDLLLLGEDPLAEADDLTALVSAARTARDDRQEQLPSVAAVSALEQAIINGEAGFQAVTEYLEAGLLGGGTYAASRVARLNGLVKQVRSAESTLDAQTRKQVSYYRDNLKSSYNPRRAGPMAALDDTLDQVLTSAELEYHQRVFENGEDPMAAWMAVREKFDPVAETSQSLIDVGFSDPFGVIAAWGRGGADEQTVRANVSVDDVERAINGGALSDEQALELLNIIDPR